MLRFFRSSNSAVVVVIILTGILIWGHVLVQADVQTETQYGAFLFRTLSGWLENVPRLPVWSGLLLTLLTGMLLVSANNRLRLTDKISYLPALCYLLLTGGIPEIHCFNPVVVAAILLITGLIQLMGSFESEKLSYSYFSAPVFISLATFFYRYMYVYMLVVWISLLLLRPGYWREWVFSVLGFVFPVFVAFGWFFLVEDDYTRMGVFFNEIFSVQRMAPQLSISSVVFFTLSSLLVIITSGHVVRYFKSKKIIVRSGYDTLIITAAVSLALFIAVPDTAPFTWYITAIPLSFFLSNYLATTKSVRWGTIVLAVLFIGVIAVQLT